MANIEVLDLLVRLQNADRPATGAEQAVLARWSSWGAVPQIFDEDRSDWGDARAELRARLDDGAFSAARRTTINAHYTHPAYARAMWDALTALGFERGRVLEPGVGAGVFVGQAPAGATVTGVELDPTTAQIARFLYPDAEIRTESFAATRLPDGHFDLVIGNVPFAEVRLHDPVHNRGGHAMHNHFIIKSLALTRPGGLVAVLTSRYTMDAQNPAARREMNQLADLVGAVRLPTGAHRRVAGTEVVTDLLLLRRREGAVAPASDEWETVTALDVDGAEVPVNRYFAANPDHVLGELAVTSGMHGSQTLQVRSDLTTAPERLVAALTSITARARAREQVYSALTVTLDVPQAAARLAAPGLWDGHIEAAGDGTFTTVNEGQHDPMPVPRSQRVELRSLLALRDGAKGLLEAEAATAVDTDDIARLRGELAARYAAYVDRHGPINRYSTRPTGRTDPETGEPRLARITPPAVRTLRSDPFAPLVMALETFDEVSQTASPATLLSQRVVAPRAPVLGTDDVQGALAVCLDVHGRVDLAEIAHLTGQDEAEAREALGTLVYDDPQHEALIPAAEYLSGNVRVKLDAARKAAGRNPAFTVNVTALEEVLPTDLGAEDVEARLGAVWIDGPTHRQFLVELLDDANVELEHPGGMIWHIAGNWRSVAASSTWGTSRMSTFEIVKASIEQRPVQVTDRNSSGNYVVNPVETAAAQEKAEAIQERFAEWVWEDPDRASRLLLEYNRRFNSIVLRDYAAEGRRLSLPGLAKTFTPRDHQPPPVARMLSEESVGLFHEVGGGKTAVMVMGVMELRRLAMANKPAVVVPNHMLEQFTREWLQLYPQARILAASAEDLAGDKRRRFVARAATNDWDAVILTRSAFERLPMSLEAQERYVERELGALRAIFANAPAGGRTVKRLEKMVLNGEQRLKEKLASAKDPGISFEQTGIDYLVVDELHDYKNLRTASNIPDAVIEGSQRATDLHMKTEYLREQGRTRVITGATATPIANSVTEAHVMTRFLRPQLLRDAGVDNFDAWAATFGQTATEVEMAPTGGGNYRMKTRFRRFQNVPEMLQMWHVFADVRTAEDLQLPIPLIRRREDGQRLPATVVVEPSAELEAYVADLGRRAEAVRNGGVDPTVDNMLKISTDGRKAALDMRLVGGTVEPDEPTKATVIADRLARRWHETRDWAYTDPLTGEPSPVTGGLQLLFCDLGTPGPGWNFYDELRDQVVARGVPRELVRFIHEAKNDAEKARLFAAARAGHIAILLGSTQKMGVGTNVQTRVTDVWQADGPWRPADSTQRDGRGPRQGNQNDEVGLWRVVTSRTFDAFIAQTLERKARFIEQMTRRRLDVRTIDDVGDSVLTFSEVKALASGDPLILDKAQADADVARLTRLQRAFQRNRDALTRRIDDGRSTGASVARDIAAVRTALTSVRDTRGDAFVMVVDGRRHTVRADAAADAGAWIATRASSRERGGHVHQLGELGELGGLRLDVRLFTYPGQDAAIEVTFRDVPARRASAELATLRGDASTLIRQLENRLADLPDLVVRLQESAKEAAAEVRAATSGLAEPFKRAEDLDEAKSRQAAIAAEMESRREDAPPPAPDVPTERDAQPDRAEDGQDLDELRRLRGAAFPQAPEQATAPSAPGHDSERPPTSPTRSPAAGRGHGRG